MKLYVKLMGLSVWRGTITVLRVHVSKLFKTLAPQQGSPSVVPTGPSVEPRNGSETQVRKQPAVCVFLVPPQVTLIQLQRTHVLERTLRKGSSRYVFNAHGRGALDTECRMGCR